MTAPATLEQPSAPSNAAPPADGTPTRAMFTNVTANEPAFPVDFNPVSLQITLANTLEEKGSGQDKKQYVSKSSAKLTMDLIFDSTNTGADVRSSSGKVAKFMEAQGPDETHRAPPTVLFEWGAFKFQGLVESYRETVDFFSHDGVPLRASVNLTMSRQEVVFTDDQAEPRSTAVNVPASFGNATEVATAGGNPRGGRGLAAANGLESMRFASGALSLDASVTLGGPVAFASAGAGIGLGVGAGLGIGASAGLSVGASAGVGVGGSLSLGFSAGAGASAGAGIGLSAGAGLSAGPAFGGSASAGVSASAGAFAGLRAGASVSGPALDPSRLVPRARAQVVAVGPQASFGIGGRAQVSGSASLGTDVGASAQATVRFDGR